MNIIGIIAEYNPFHNGHAYQIACAKKQFGADAVVVVMSGDFTQRGIPAVFHKESRANMALSCGADRSEERRVGKECRSRWSPYH